MSEQEVTAPAAAATPDAGTESKPEASPTLESLYSEYNVQAPQPQPAAPEVAPAAPVVQPQPAVQPSYGDPDMDPTARAVAQINQELQSFRQEIVQQKAEAEAAAAERDLNSAVKAVVDSAGLSGKERMARVYLEARGREDGRLAQVWANRGNNPDAWNKALNILATEFKSEFSTPNPQLEENQRAMDESQKLAGAQAPPATSREGQVLQMNDADFQTFWGKLAGHR